MVRFAVPGQQTDGLAYTDFRLPTVPVVQGPRRPGVNDKKYPLWCEWRVNKEAQAPAVEGEFWKLIRFESNGDATWAQFAGAAGGTPPNILTDSGAPNVQPDAATGEFIFVGGAGISVTGTGPGKTVTFSLTGGGAAVDTIQVDTVTAPGVNPVAPDAAGIITISGNTIANAGTPVITHSRAVNEFDIDVQVSTALGGAPIDRDDAGLASFDTAAFDVDANGFVTLAGGVGSIPIVEIDVDSASGTGTDPAEPDANGVIIFTGTAVNNAGFPLSSVSSAANTVDYQIQVAAARTGAPGDKADAGICSFDDTAFAVDADGYVTLAGGAGPAVDSLTVQNAVGPGTVITVPDAAGNIDISGNVVANATHATAFETNSIAQNAILLDLQLSAAVAAPGAATDAGISSFDQIFFEVNAAANTTASRAIRKRSTPYATNLGIDYSSPTFTITASFGGSLSATNVAVVNVPSKLTPGLWESKGIVSDVSFTDASGASDIIGNTFGTTAGVAWAQAMPFYIYAVIKDDDSEVRFMIARHPAAKFSSSIIGTPSSPVANTERSFWCFDNITVGDFDNNPCVCLGSFRMQKDAADDWTVSAINSTDGIGRYQETRQFTMAINQNGATDRYFSSTVGGDTLPTFNTDGYRYWIKKSGFIQISYQATNVTNTPAGAGQMQLHLPFKCAAPGSFYKNSGQFSYSKNGGAQRVGFMSILSSGVTGNSFYSLYGYEVKGTDCPIFTPGDLVGPAASDGNFSFHGIYQYYIDDASV